MKERIFRSNLLALSLTLLTTTLLSAPSSSNPYKSHPGKREVLRDQAEIDGVSLKIYTNKDRDEGFQLSIKSKTPVAKGFICKLLVQRHSDGTSDQSEQLFTGNLYPKGTHFRTNPNDKYEKLIEFRLTPVRKLAAPSDEKMK